MIKLKSLLLEDMGSAELSKALESAYKVTFDVDEIIILAADAMWPPSYMHQYFVVKLYFIYKLRKFVIYHKLYYYKFPENELKGLSRDEWMEMLKVAEKFPRKTITRDLLNSRNVLIDFSMSVFEADKSISDLNLLEKVEGLRSIAEVVTEAKRIIDKRIGGDNREVDSPVDVPSPRGELQPAQ